MAGRSIDPEKLSAVKGHNAFRDRLPRLSLKGLSGVDRCISGEPLPAGPCRALVVWYFGLRAQVAEDPRFLRDCSPSTQTVLLLFDLVF